MQTLVAQPQTQRTYDRACRRFVAWLGPLAGPEDLTSTQVASYHPVLAAGRASSTVKRERAAINSWLRWLVEFGHIPAEQARAALAIKLPRAQQAEREQPKSLSAEQYDRLPARRAGRDRRRAARRRPRPRDPAGPQRRRPALLGARRAGAPRPSARGKLRALNVRHGKGDRDRTVKLTVRATRAILRWERERTRVLDQAADNAPLFITLGRRRQDGRHGGVGRRCGQPVLAAIMKRVGAVKAGRGSVAYCMQPRAPGSLHPVAGGRLVNRGGFVPSR